MLKLNNIDNGKPFDWGKASEDYGKYRDIYPESYYHNLKSLGLDKPGISLLDLATGTGVLPRALYRTDISITGTDISGNQIAVAGELAAGQNLNISFHTAPAENTGLPSQKFDYITAAQCFLYFNVPGLMKEIDRLLKPDGRFIITWFAWLPDESEIASESEKLILGINPDWKGAGYKRMHVDPDQFKTYGYKMEKEFSYSEDIPFTRDTWAGRIRATRGVGAVLDGEGLKAFDSRHKSMLENNAPDQFAIPHHVLINSYRKNR